MVTARTTPKNIDEYIAVFPPGVQKILERIRSTISKAAPGAQEAISYRIPTFTQNGTLVYFAAFRNHIGLYPPAKGDAGLEKAISRYAGEKGNLRFPLDGPIPYRLIGRIVKLRVKQNLAKAAAKGEGGRRRRFPRTVLDAISDAKMIGVRSGKEHRFTGVWVVAVRRRVFIRSWNDKPHGWYRAFVDEPLGTMRLDSREIAVRARRTRGDVLLDAIEQAYGDKYDTKASQKWVRGFRHPRRRATTTELAPR